MIDEPSSSIPPYRNTLFCPHDTPSTLGGQEGAPGDSPHSLIPCLATRLCNCSRYDNRIELTRNGNKAIFNGPRTVIDQS